MSYLLKYKLLQAYTELGWKPGKFVPANYFMLHIGSALSCLVNEQDHICIKNRAAEFADHYGYFSIQNSKNLYYAIGTNDVRSWRNAYNDGTISIGSKAIIDNMSWKKLGDNELKFYKDKDFYDNLNIAVGSSVYVYFTALYNDNNTPPEGQW